ncbi:MAG: replication initiation protein [Pseudoalteromonas prydzensis]|uniref:replication initiation protein n=1 Tax=Pseudoalteromonas prydzensis TaxID=182141 RepID=UPI003F9703C2
MEEIEYLGLQKFNVAMSNKLIRASHTLSLVEKRCIAGIIAKVDSRKGRLAHAHLAEFTKISLSAVEYAETYGIDIKTAYRDLNKAADQLFDRQVTIKNASDKGKVTKFRWVSSVTYAEKQGYIELSFTEEIYPHLNVLGREFKQYKLKNASSFRSVYTWRLFEYANSWLEFCREKKTHVTVTVENLRTTLDVPASYSYKDFRVRALEPAINEIKKHSNIDIEFTPIKKGRSFHSIEITVKLSQQLKLDLN